MIRIYVSFMVLGFLFGLALFAVVARADSPPKQCYQVCYPNGRCWTVCP